MTFKQQLAAYEAVGSSLKPLSTARSVSQIVAFFVSKKIKGVPRVDDRCPVAVYVKKTIKGASSIVVAFDQLSFMVGDCACHFPLDGALSDFILRFDEIFVGDDEDVALLSSKERAKDKKRRAEFAPIMAKECV